VVVESLQRCCPNGTTSCADIEPQIVGLDGYNILILKLI